MQNSGIDYKSEEQFDITSSLSGTVTNIADDALLGKTVLIQFRYKAIIGGCFMKNNIGEKICQYRQMQKMTQEEFASRLGVTPQAVGK